MIMKIREKEFTVDQRLYRACALDEYIATRAKLEKGTLDSQVVYTAGIEVDLDRMTPYASLKNEANSMYTLWALFRRFLPDLTVCCIGTAKQPSSYSLAIQMNMAFRVTLVPGEDTVKEALVLQAWAHPTSTLPNMRHPNRDCMLWPSVYRQLIVAQPELPTVIGLFNEACHFLGQPVVLTPGDLEVKFNNVWDGVRSHNAIFVKVPTP